MVWKLSTLADVLNKNSFNDFYSVCLHSLLSKEKFEGFCGSNLFKRERMIL